MARGSKDGPLSPRKGSFLVLVWGRYREHVHSRCFPRRPFDLLGFSKVLWAELISDFHGRKMYSRGMSCQLGGCVDLFSFTILATSTLWLRCLVHGGHVFHKFPLNLSGTKNGHLSAGTVSGLACEWDWIHRFDTASCSVTPLFVLHPKGFVILIIWLRCFTRLGNRDTLRQLAS